VGWHGLARSRIRYPLLANAVQRLLTAMVGQDREEANRLQLAKWELTTGEMECVRNVGDHRSSRPVPDEVLATTGLGGSARQMSASVFHPSSGRPDCVAGHTRLELRNVVAKYPFERGARICGNPAESGHGEGFSHRLKPANSLSKYICDCRRASVAENSFFNMPPWPLQKQAIANGEQMSRLSSVLGACCSNHRLRPRPTRRG
jgi:hypothetical protein